MAVLWAMSLPGLVVLLVVLASLERFGLWAGRRSWIPWRRQADRPPLSAGAFDEFTASFYGSKRVEMEQRKTELMLRDDEQDGAPPRGRVDLDRGVVSLGKPSRPANEPPV
jgi:hypothetical protein